MGFKQDYKYSKIVRVWLVIGLVMLIGQVILGGITRLTGSGLSITKWEIISGTIPPLNASEWQAEFELYKQTPQYHKINTHFELKDFKFIYFWEYFHRLWARILGFMFVIPFVFFLIKKKVDAILIKKLAMVILFAGLTASAGWIMVKSGLVNRPWVNAYKLSLHFMLALISITFMVKILAYVYNFGISGKILNKKPIVFTIVLLFIQMIFAGLMAGMKAGLYYKTWPSMNGNLIPQVLKDTSNFLPANLTNYDTFLFAPALVQFIHRLLAYILLIITIYLFVVYRNKISGVSKFWLQSILFLIFLQLILGILTVVSISPGIPLTYGVLHQLVGLLYFIALWLFYFSISRK
ncbi:MAG: heme A synthase [Flavobacteriales bacterium]|nr:MAG: heme A synthase [Flavobacteriales bacterium]PIE48864.1 MAG: heme A synthase [Flavobacteriales bacterium]